MAFLRDAHLEIVPLVDEDPHSYVMSYDLERYDSGIVAGDFDMPEDRERELFHFHCISSITPIYPDSWPYDTLRSTLNYYYGGGQLRVYRFYPANLVEWDVTNEFGYSDVVQADVNGASFQWFNMKMTIFNFDIDGVNVA